LIDIYPDKYIEKELYGENGIMSKKFLQVSGVKLSLDDIHENIMLGKFSHQPVVIYGLFQGVIGGPNIRSVAYNGKNVIKQLQLNAIEFINSNRGTFKGRNDIMRVSVFYDRNRQLFPDFNNDIKNHLDMYIDDKYEAHLEGSNQIRANISDMTLVNLTAGTRRKISSHSTNPAAFTTALISGDPGTVIQMTERLSQYAFEAMKHDFLGFSVEDVKLLEQLKNKFNANRGKVEIESEN